MCVRGKASMRCAEASGVRKTRSVVRRRSVCRRRNGSEINLRAQLENARVEREIASITGGANVVSLELEVFGEIPVRAECPVVLLAAANRRGIQIELAVAQQQLERTPWTFRLDVVDVTVGVRARFAGQHPAAEHVETTGIEIRIAAVARDGFMQRFALHGPRTGNPQTFE